MSSKVYKVSVDALAERFKKVLETPEEARQWLKPHNFVKGNCNPEYKKPYRGINRFLTSLCGYSSPFWVTYKQIKKYGGNIIGGYDKAKFLPIIFPIFQRWQDDDGTLHTKFKCMMYHNVINVEEVEGLPESLVEISNLKSEFEDIKSAEDVISSYGDCPKIEVGNPSYSPTLDVIRMPEKLNFKSEGYYYHTLFHEAIHSTGHESRLNRNLDSWFGEEDYGKEELVAEIGASILAGVAGFNNEELERNEEAYVHSWLKAISEAEPLHIYQACRDADSASRYILEGKDG